ncbi:MAG: YggS family pyridoxal phosphate-dependent enzyme [Luteolibacter sp.]
MSSVEKQLAEIRRRVSVACERAGRDEAAVTLVAVSKTFPAEAIREAAEAGQIQFGESRFQDAEPKIAELSEGLEWHFIGGVQRNKVRKILSLFGCVHAIDSLKLAKYTDGVAVDLGLKPEIFLQVNLAGEDSKGGFSVDEIREAMGELKALMNVKILGLMMIPPADDGARGWFRGLREFRDVLEKDFSVELPFLSMGMSGDFEIAIEEGATHVRVGSAIFGKREGKVEGELG